MGGNHGILVWHAGQEIDGTSVGSLLIGFGAAGGTGIPVDMEFGDVVKNPRAGGFGMVTIEYLCLGSAVWVISALSRNGLIEVASNNDRSPVAVVGAKYDFNKVFDYELRGAFVLAYANIVTHLPATRSGKKLNTVHKDKDSHRGYVHWRASDYSVNIGGELQYSTCGTGRGQADMSCGSGRVLGTMAGGGGVPPAQ